jgi:ABC-2 type transport system ATP-binding protein
MKITKDSSPAISVRNLSRTYVVHERDLGLVAAVKSLVQRKYKQVHAVQDVSFNVAQGELIGFLGPNGAGKTTTIKMLSGLLYPTAGECTVLGHKPFSREKSLLKQISLVMGRRDQLIWDIPALESFEFFRLLYGVPKADYQRILNDLSDLMEIGPLLKKPVRNLSLGERMKCELVGALLHRPKVLFLDEPTLGLDVLAQQKFRDYIRQYNRRFEATIILTSHYVPDVEDLCDRVIFIDEGKLIFDGSLTGLVEQLLPYKLITVSIEGGSPRDMRAYGQEVARHNGHLTLQVAKEQTVGVTSRLVANLPVKDLVIKDPPLEDLIKHVYKHGFHAAEHVELRHWRRPPRSEMEDIDR